MRSNLGMGAAFVACVSLACAPGMGEEADVASAEVAAVPASLSEQPVWDAVSTSGVSVRVRPDPTPIRPGIVTLDIMLDAELEDPLPLSVDLLSPEMPMHGIQRSTAEVVDPHHYRVTTEIPMAGEWEIYVNLDFGANTALFALEVPAADGSTGHVHGSDAPAMDGMEGDRGNHSMGAADSSAGQGSHDAHSMGSGA